MRTDGTPPTEDTVRAAGGVVSRARDGRTEIALVHRPRYDDWSLPKGKLDAGETELDAAVREVGEEIGARVVVGRRLDPIEYRFGPGTPKTVALWAMRYTGGGFVPNAEVDEVAWLPPSDALGRLSYDVERQALEQFRSWPAADASVVLVRHAKAGKRSEWAGPDAQRPLDSAGRQQAQALVGFLHRFAPKQVLAGAPARCVQTVEPFAADLGVGVTVEPVFSDAHYEIVPHEARAALYALGRPGGGSVICSQGVTIPGLLQAVAPGVEDTRTKKGAAWVLSFSRGEVLAADYYPDAAR